MTIEGNTNIAGSREGTHALRKERGFSIERGDRFVRWYEAQQLVAAA